MSDMLAMQERLAEVEELDRLRTTVRRLRAEIRSRDAREALQRQMLAASAQMQMLQHNPFALQWAPPEFYPGLSRGLFGFGLV